MIPESCPKSSIVHCPVSLLPPYGSSFAGAAAMSYERMWLSMAFVIHPTWGCSLTSLCLFLILHVSFVKWPKKESIFQQGSAPYGLIKRNYNLCYSQMNLCDLWPMEMVVLIESRWRNQACLVWLVIFRHAKLSIWVSGILWRCLNQKEAAFVAWDFNTGQTRCSHICLRSPGDLRKMA